MTLEKVIQIKGIGKYVDFTASEPEYGWDGSLAKNTLVYADNASGKTTFAQIIKSLSKSSDIEDFRKRKTFDYTSNPSIKVSVNNGCSSSINEYDGKDWQQYYDNIIVFDTFFVERNIYVLSPSKKTGDAETINVLLGEESLKVYDKITSFRKEQAKLGGTKGNLIKKKKEIEISERLKEQVKTAFNIHNELSLDDVNKRIEELNEKIRLINKEISQLQQQLNNSTDAEKYIQATNEILSSLAPGIKLSALFMKSKSTIVYGVKINGHTIRSNSESSSLKRIFSDGEKNAVAFSFFLAKLKMLKDLDKYLVVFDDPLSSMDATRRSASIYQLSVVANKVAQFILLSHDKLFVRDFINTAERIKAIDKKHNNLTVLKIGQTNTTSAIIGYDIEEDTKTGLMKDLETIIDFRDNVEGSKYSIEEVASSIRKVVEGILRLKYSAAGCFAKAKTLGAIIDEIERNDEAMFTYDKNHIDELKELNYYSSTFHHSDPSKEQVAINKTELANYCKKALALLMNL